MGIDGVLAIFALGMLLIMLPDTMIVIAIAVPSIIIVCLHMIVMRVIATFKKLMKKA